MTQKNEKIDLLENISRNTLDFQLVRNLQSELDQKTQKLEKMQKQTQKKQAKTRRTRTMTMSSLTRRSLLLANNPDLAKLRTSISRQSGPNRSEQAQLDDRGAREVLQNGPAGAGEPDEPGRLAGDAAEAEQCAGAELA